MVRNGYYTDGPKMLEPIGFFFFQPSLNNGFMVHQFKFSPLYSDFRSIVGNLLIDLDTNKQKLGSHKKVRYIADDRFDKTQYNVYERSYI